MIIQESVLFKHIKILVVKNFASIDNNFYLKMLSGNHPKSFKLCAKIFLITSILAISFDLKISHAQVNNDVETQFDHAVELYNDDKLDEARELFLEIPDKYCDQEQFIEICVESKVHLSLIDRRNRNFSTSENFLIEAETALENNLNPSPRLFTQISMHKVFLYIEMEQFEDAQTVADDALQLSMSENMEGISRGRTYLASAYLEDELGNYQEAIQYYTEAISSVLANEKSDDILKFLSQTYNNIAVTFRKTGELDKSLEFYEDALDINRELYGSNHAEVGLILNNIGTISYLSGDYGNAADYFIRSSDIYRNNVGEFHGRLAAIYNNAGVSYLQMDQVDRATEYLERAQRIKEDFLGLEHMDTAIGYTNLAQIYIENENYDAARENFEKSISIRENIHSPDHPSLVAPLIQYASYFSETGDFATARTTLERAKNIVTSRIGENHPDNWDILVKKGNIYVEEKKFYMASHRFFNAIKQITSNSDFSPADEIDLNSVSHPFILLEALKKSAFSELSIYQMNKNIKHLYRANDLYNHAFETVDLLQFNYRSEASKLNLLDSNYDIYSNAILVNKLLFEETQNSEWLDNIFTISEISRSRIALELFQANEAKTFAGVPTAILDQESRINEKISEFYQKISLEVESESDDNINSSTTEQYRDSLFYYKDQLFKLTQELEKQYPVYHELKFDKTLVNRSEIGHLVNNHSIVSYIFGEEELFVIILQDDGIDFKSLPAPKNLSNRIDQLRNYVLTNDKKNYMNEAYHLYEELVKPIEEIIANSLVTFIPDQALHYLPFEMLITENPQDLPYHELPYLLKKYKIGYAPSVTVMDFMDDFRPSSPKNLFAYAPFHQIDQHYENLTGLNRFSDSFRPLPLTRYETREISNLFTQKRTFTDYFFPERTSIYLDDEASRSNLFQANLSEYSFLHFATHAFVNKNNPALSGILLRGNNDEDGTLFVNDIYNLNLNADLVVLGACDTGLGNVHRGEGMIGFTRAFIFAGASNLVSSLWPVNDQPTAFLMIDFYKNFRNGMPYSDALQQAKLNLISHPEFSSPRDWAAFVLYGN